MTTYRPVVSSQSSTAKATALVGSDSVILGFDVLTSQVNLDDLLGFAINRMDVATGAMEWLRGQKYFGRDAAKNCTEMATNLAPIQQFRWGDFSLKPDTEYLYRIYPVVGMPAQLFLSAPAILEVVTACNRSAEIELFFGRGGASLSRGLEPALLGFIEAADAGDDLKVAMAQLQHPALTDALQSAAARGVRVCRVFDAKGPYPEGARRPVVAHAVASPSKNITPRRRRPRLHHSNFIVHNTKGVPRRVWTSSADVTGCGLTPQTTIGIIFHHSAVARAFDQFFQLLQQDLPLSEMRDHVAQLTDRYHAELDPDHRLYFAPVKDIEVLRVAWGMLWHAKQAVFVGCPDGVDRSLLDALRDNPNDVLCYGVVKRVAKSPTLEFIDRTIFAAQEVPAVSEPGSSDGSMPTTNLLIVDPWTRNPRVLVSLGDLCDESQHRGDAHAILIEKDSRAAAILGTELMHIYHHYKSAALNASAERDPAARYLSENGSWTLDYYNPFKAKYRERIAFAGL